LVFGLLSPLFFKQNQTKIKMITSKHNVNGLPDSGSRTNFSTGAVRDAMEGKGLPSMIPTCALMSLAKRFEDGASKYGPDNWKKGIPLSRYYDAASRHLWALRDGKTDEDHFGAVLWNIACWQKTKRMIDSHLLPQELNDL
jgi:hypothetical protein